MLWPVAIAVQYTIGVLISYRKLHIHVRYFDCFFSVLMKNLEHEEEEENIFISKFQKLNNSSHYEGGVSE